ncbi:MAG TPA: DUF1223 domain-containing protein [Spirochaetia bacterium]|nr:DUF1223 domain-containing protein [Spirochaetia bacterium]
MNHRFLVLAGLLAAALPSAAQPQGFAVVELFTSEGCSSCPPADEALAQLARDADSQRLPVFALEWHVDYWDYLGWKDPWDSRDATERQYAYSRALPSPVYTPQAIINGQTVPSWAGDLGELRREATEAAARRALVDLSVDAAQETGGHVRARISVSGAPAGTVLVVTEVEGELGATPSAGENAGRALLHSAVVRAFESVPAVSGEVVLPSPAGTRAPRREVVAFVQDPRSMKILAAAKADLAPAVSVLSGRVTSTDGRPMPDVLVQACSGSRCIPGRTDAAGYFRLEEVPAGSYEVDFSSAGPQAGRIQLLDVPDSVRVAKTVWLPAG